MYPHESPLAFHAHQRARACNSSKTERGLATRGPSPRFGAYGQRQMTGRDSVPGASRGLQPARSLEGPPSPVDVTGGGNPRPVVQIGAGVSVAGYAWRGLR